MQAVGIEVFKPHQIILREDKMLSNNFRTDTC